MAKAKVVRGRKRAAATRKRNLPARVSPTPSRAAEAPAVSRKPAAADATSVARKLRRPGTTTTLAVLSAGRRSAESVVMVNRKLWLAALGAVAETQKRAGAESAKTLAALVKAGEVLESNARRLVDRSASAALGGIAVSSDSIDRRLRKLEDGFDARVAAALSHLGMPTVRALAGAIDKVERLQTKVLRLDPPRK